MPESIGGKKEKIPPNVDVFLNKLLAGERIPEDSRVAVVMAHPDDEAIAAGAQIQHFPNCLMVHITDGAPADPNEWHKSGFTSQEDYGQAREKELADALNISGHTGVQESFSVPDQQVAFKLIENTKRLADLFEKHRTRFVITHAYEGGHPDHDAVAFSVHAAKRFMGRKGQKLGIIEAPLYRVENARNIMQSFVPLPNVKVFSIPLSDEQRVIKSRMYAAHGSQGRVLAKMSTDTEQFRGSPRYDFKKPASSEGLSYLFANAGVDEVTWRKLVTDALVELGIEKSSN